jgi:hypothetical protein
MVAGVKKQEIALPGSGQMANWMDGWMDGWIDGWMDEV